MVQIFRDSSGGILDDACGELEINMAGEGTVSVSKDEKIYQNQKKLLQEIM